jgi:putative hydrolase of the HAD superfamily
MREFPDQARQKKFRVVFFDLGNTLIYSDGDFQDVSNEASLALVRTLQSVCCDVDEKEFVRAFSRKLDIYYREREADFIEDTTEFVLKNLLREYGYTDVPHKLLRAALDDMYTITQTRWHAEEDAIPMLKQLCELGYHTGIISNAADAHDVQRLVDQSGLRSYLEQIVISAEVGIRKPHPRIFEEALAYWGLPAQQAVMVGDTLGADVLGALNVNMPCVWITRRADTPENRAQTDIIQPDAIIQTLGELPELLEHWGIFPDRSVM